jgi:hypothetical protein
MNTIYFNEHIEKVIEGNNMVHVPFMPIFKFCNNRMAIKPNENGSIHRVDVVVLDKKDPITDLVNYLQQDRHTFIYPQDNRYIHYNNGCYWSLLTMI